MKISLKRRRIGYTYGSVSGSYAFRDKRTVLFESLLEKDFITLFDFNDSVEDIIEQPFTIEYINNNGIATTYTPDYLVHFKQPEYAGSEIIIKPLLVEVKYRDKITNDFKNLKSKFKIGIKYAKANNMIFKIFDEYKIRTEYLEKTKFLSRYKNFQYDKSEEEMILDYVRTQEKTTIAHTVEYLYNTDIEKGIAIGHIWYLISTKKLFVDISKPLNQRTIISISNI